MAWCLQAQVLVSSAGIYFEGAKAFPGPKQNNIFAMTMRHNGSPVFKGTNGVTQRFSHRRRNTVFSYNLQTNETDIVGDLTGGNDLFSRPSHKWDFVFTCHIAWYHTHLELPTRKLSQMTLQMKLMSSCTGSCATGVSCPTAFIGLSPYSYWTVFFNASSADLTEASPKFLDDVMLP